MRHRLILILLINCFFLSGCETLLIAGATTTAVASQDRRDVETQLADQSNEFKVLSNLFNDDAIWENTNISVVSYNQVILLVGQAPTASLKEKATQEVKKVAPEAKLLNQIKIAAPISFVARRNDEYLTTKVKSKMLFTANFPSAKIKVVTENSEVFLLGLVTEAEAAKAVDIARNVSGVKKVIKVFEYISEQT